MKPSLDYLSREEVRTIHQASLKILRQVGMRFPHEEAQKLLTKAGAKTAGEGVVRIPSGLVDEALASLPRRGEVVLYGRNPKHDFSFADHSPALACMTMATSVIDPVSGRKRPATDPDLVRLVRLAHHLEHFRVNGGLVTPQEVPGRINDWHTWATCLKNTTKHITGGVVGAMGVRDAVAMASLAAGGEELFLKRPCISGWVLTLPPLGIDRDSLEALLELARCRVPAMISSGPILGATSPVTIPGTLAQAHAEILGCLVVHQLARPGAPAIYTSFARGVDMRTGNVSMAGPEFALLKLGMAALGALFDLPVRMPAMLRDAKTLDAQAGFETGMVAGLTCLAADLMDAGQLDMDLVVDLADPVFCNEAMAALKRLNRDQSVDRDSLALEAIREAGPGGSFLNHTHTFTHFKKELHHPALFERRNWEAWEKDGGRSIREVCLQKALEILDRDREPFLDPETEHSIDLVVERASI